jgi:putative intracellular protease/amidase
MTRILMVVTSHDELLNGHKTGLWLDEYGIPYNEFAAAGFDIVTASPKGGGAPIDPRSFEAKAATSTFAKAMEQLERTRRLEEIEPAPFDAIFFPGGHGPMFDLAQDARVKVLLRHFVDAGKLYAAVCHGPAAFLGATTASGQPLIAGKRLTAFTNEEEREVGLDKAVPFLLEDKLRDEGANFEKAPNWSDHVVTDGMLITGQNPQSAASAARAVISALRTPAAR